MSNLQTRSAFDIELTAENLERLADWVANFASAEELAWNADQFKDLRNLLKVRKAASALRIEAVRLESVALRRIGLANLENKLPAHERRVARWFAEMTGDDFDKLLNDCENEVSPLSFMRECENEQRYVSRHIAGYGDFDPNAEIEPMDILREAHNILSSLDSFDSFTVEQAANSLLDRLKDVWGDELPREFAATPLREVVRTVLRLPGPGEGTFEIGDVYFSLPTHVTWFDSGVWRRIPWQRASVAHLQTMVENRELQADQLVRKAAEMRQLLTVIESCVDSQNESADAGFVTAIQQNKIRTVSYA